MFTAVLLIMGLSLIWVAFFEIRTLCSDSDSDCGVAGSLTFDTPRSSGCFLRFRFEYHGGGICWVRAVSEKDYENCHLSEPASYVLFVMNDDGKVVDSFGFNGNGAFASKSDSDWLAMKRQIEPAWKYYFSS